MTTLLIKNAELLATMDSRRREIAKGCIWVENGVISAVGSADSMPQQQPDKTIDATNKIVLPGLVNTHHHMYQSLTRVIPKAQDCELFTWLKTLYPIWGGLTPDMIKVSTKTAMAELILSGCTTSSDHLYIYPNGCRLDDSIEAAAEMGMRFHPTRGAMSLGESRGGLPPDRLVEDEDYILKDAQRLIETYHDSSPYSMLRVGIAPCSPFSVTRDLMSEAAKLARDYGVGLHTHLAENIHDIEFSREKYGCTPAQYAQDLGWLGDDVWHAHCVQLDEEGISLFARSSTGVAHCPCSNMRLASGIAPVREMLDAGVKISLAVDGSASNDGGHMLGEARQAMLLARVGSCNPGQLSAREALEIATLGGARVLQRNDIGSLEEGKAADIIAFDTRQVAYGGAGSDYLAALLFCSPQHVDFSIINGEEIVRDGQLLKVELQPLLTEHRKYAEQLVEEAPV